MPAAGVGGRISANSDILTDPHIPSDSNRHVSKEGVAHLAGVSALPIDDLLSTDLRSLPMLGVFLFLFVWW